MAQVEIPCVKFPKLPEIPEIELIGGAKLRGLLDFSKGMPSNCSVTFSLLAQLSPMLAGLVPILNILCVIKALGDFATNPLVKGPDLIAAIQKVAGMFISLTPAGIAVTILGILRLIISFLNCFISVLESNVSFQAKIDLAEQNLELDGGIPNLALRASLDCARANASISMEQAMATLGPIQPLLEIVQLVAGIAGLPLELPSMEMSAEQGAGEVIESLKATIGGLEDVINSLPV